MLPAFVRNHFIFIFWQDFEPEKKKLTCRVLRYLAHQHAASLLFYSAKDTGLLKRVKQTPQVNLINQKLVCPCCVLLYLAHQHAASLLFYSAKDTGLLKRVKQTPQVYITINVPGLFWAQMALATLRPFKGPKKSRFLGPPPP